MMHFKIWVAVMLMGVLHGPVNANNRGKDGKDGKGPIDSNNPVSSDLYKLQPELYSLINAQIGTEMHASLVYMTMASHFGAANKNRLGLKKFFLKNSHEEREHALKLMEYLVSRDGQITSMAVKMPTKFTWTSAKDALHDALILENGVSADLQHMHRQATSDGFWDPHLADMLESDFFSEQVESVRELNGYITTLKSMGDDHHLAEYLFDQQLLRDEK